MAFVNVSAAALNGFEIGIVNVEVNVDFSGFPNFKIVGLAAKEVEEAKERVRSAIKNSGYKFPNRKITVNLAPADLPKKGSSYDLAIAIGILAVSGVVTDKSLLNNKLFVGELSLNGNIISNQSIISLLSNIGEEFSTCVIPVGNTVEASLLSCSCIAVKNLKELVDVLNGSRSFVQVKQESFNKLLGNNPQYEIDFSEISGHEHVKRALEIAITGGHNIMLVGPPGSGKTMLARASDSIQPSMNLKESLEVSSLHFMSGRIDFKKGILTRRPFRSPHHSISPSNLIGGGNPLKPGEVTLAHLGILFIDEFAELSRASIESLRLPLEDGEIAISRSRKTVNFPCRFILIAASNQCPCGNLGVRGKECQCPEHKLKEYNARISFPIRDRIDMHVFCSSEDVDSKELVKGRINETSDVIRTRIESARMVQKRRYSDELKLNAYLSPKEVREFCVLQESEQDFVKEIRENLNLTNRSLYKLIKISRTIADLEGSEMIKLKHISEALLYRDENAS